MPEESAAAYLKLRVRPLTIGLSIGSRYGSAGGTLGAFVSNSRGNLGFLTAATALEAYNARRKDLVYQPSSLDAGTLAARDAVGEIQDFIPLSKTGNFADAALVNLLERIEVTGNIIPDLPGCEFAGRLIKPETVAAEDLNLRIRVAKIGRSSGYTEGNITSLTLTNLRVKSWDSIYIFDRVIEITSVNDEPFSLSGDAGALIFTIPDLRPIGLLFAAGRGSSRQQVSYACHLDRVLEKLRVQLRI